VRAGLAALLALVLAACVSLDGKRSLEVLAIRGQLAQRERIALPPNALAIVELREGPGGTGAVVAEQRIELKGRQSPIPFALDVPRERLDRAKMYAARGGIVVDGRPAWVSESIIIDPVATLVDVGTLAMTAAEPRGFAADFRCGDQRITIDFGPRDMRLTAGADRYELAQTRSADGARYEAVGDPGTWFWNRGRKATLSVKGRTYPECEQVKP
jgi:uncharacterized lipoprotein YbaY